MLENGREHLKKIDKNMSIERRFPRPLSFKLLALKFKNSIWVYEVLPCIFVLAISISSSKRNNCIKPNVEFKMQRFVDRSRWKVTPFLSSKNH